MKNKVNIVLYSVSNFLRNPKIPIPLKKKIILNSIVISKVSFFAPLLRSNKKHSKQSQSTINIGLGWVAGVGKAKLFTSTYSISKDLIIPPLTAKCALAQVRCLKKWENSNCMISYFVNNIHSDKHYMWTRSSKNSCR